MNTERRNYQGWTNYATWRIALEMYDNYELDNYEAKLDVYDLAKHLKEQTEYFVCEDTDNSELCKSYALAFLAQVDFYQMAQHLKEYY